MIKCAIIGASGYTGAELANLVQRHPQLSLRGAYVSGSSIDAGKPLSLLHPQWLGTLDIQLTPLHTEQIQTAARDVDVVLLALDHKISHDIVPALLETGVVVMDLSGAFRFDSVAPYQTYYGFTHNAPGLLKQAVYGLAEWNADAIKAAQLVAVPGCYPTASLLALKPLQNTGLLKEGSTPVINAVSGVSGAGRKASMVNSFCEVSLNAYGVLGHRHQPEIALHLGNPVIFTPHLGNFKRGILATITAQLAEDVSDNDIKAAFETAYTGKAAVRLYNQTCPGCWPSIAAVSGSPYCDIAWKQDGEHIVISSAIDNLLKGAASQALQCVNLRFGLQNFPFEQEVTL